MAQEKRQKTLPMAVYATICGGLIIIPFAGVLFGLVAIVLGFLSLNILRRNDITKGRGLAIFSVVLGLIGGVVIPAVAYIAAVTVPNLIKARVAANEAFAVSDLNLIVSAEIQYRAVHSDYAILAQLGYATPPYIDSTLAKGEKDGYKYTVVVISENSFYATAIPDKLFGARSFYIDEDALLCRAILPEVSVPFFHVDIGCPPNFLEVLE